MSCDKEVLIQSTVIVSMSCSDMLQFIQTILQEKYSLQCDEYYLILNRKVLCSKEYPISLLLESYNAANVKLVLTLKGGVTFDVNMKPVSRISTILLTA